MVTTQRHATSRQRQGSRAIPRSTAFRRVKRNLTWDQLVYAIDNDPIFRVTTHDEQFWIEPFTGKRVKLDGDLLQVARRHYKAHDYWRKLALKTYQEVVYWRWMHFLQESIRQEPRLRFFRFDGVWLNPFDGEWYDCIRRTEGRVTATTLHEMAKVLSTIDDPTVEMLSLERLRTIIDSSTAYTSQASQPPREVSLPEEHRPAAGGGGAGPAVAPAEPVESAESADDPASDSVARGKRTGSTKARQVQQHMLGVLPELPGIEMAVHYAPQGSVSGDFYECIRLDDHHVLIALGDVTGHGVQAALTMAMVLKTLRMVSRDQEDVVEIACQLSQEVARDLLPEQFFSMYLGMLDLRTQELTSICAGHHPAVVVNPGGPVLLALEGSRGGAIGVTRPDRLRASFAPARRNLLPGDILVLYSDGINEAMNAQDEQFGHFRLYANLVGQLERFTNLQDFIDGLAQEAGRFAAGNIDDDVTIFALRITPAE
jgi:serine phosphatase RsbU (regulator of sigma subunit)